MSLQLPEVESNRFTLADYTYDSDVPEASGSRHNTPSLSPSGDHGLSPSPTIFTSPSTPPAPAARPTRPRKQGSGSSSGSGSKRGLRLHQPDERPVYHHGPSTPWHTHPTTGSSGTAYPPSLPMGTSSLSSDIRPLPSLPRSHSSSRSLRTELPLLPRTPDFTRPTDFSPPTSTDMYGYSPYGSGPREYANRPTAYDVERAAPLSPAYIPRPSSTSYSVQEAEVKEKESESQPMTRGFSAPKPSWWDRHFPSSWPCRLLLLTVILESLVDLAIEGNILWRFNAEVKSSSSTELELENKRRLPVYLVIYGLAHLWQLVLTFVAVYTRNTVQVVAVTAFNFAFLGYAVIQIYELRKILGDNLAQQLTSVTNVSESTLLSLPLNVLTAVVIAVLAVGSLALVVLSYFIRREFGWDRYRFLGADLQIRKYYLRFQVYECICYFSAFFCSGFGIQFIWLVLQKTDVEYIITWVAFPALILLLVMGRFAAKYENYPSMAVFLLGLVAGWAYFIFKLVRIWQRNETTYLSLTKSLTLFNALSLASLISCFIGGVLVCRDFGKGLKTAVLNQPKATSLPSTLALWPTRSKASEHTPTEMTMAQRRISID